MREDQPETKSKAELEKEAKEKAEQEKGSRKAGLPKKKADAKKLDLWGAEVEDTPFDPATLPKPSKQKGVSAYLINCEMMNTVPFMRVFEVLEMLQVCLPRPAPPPCFTLLTLVPTPATRPSPHTSP